MPLYARTGAGTTQLPGGCWLPAGGGIAPGSQRVLSDVAPRSYVVPQDDAARRAHPSQAVVRVVGLVEVLLCVFGFWGAAITLPHTEYLSPADAAVKPADQFCGVHAYLPAFATSVIMLVIVGVVALFGLTLGVNKAMGNAKIRNATTGITFLAVAVLGLFAAVGVPQVLEQLEQAGLRAQVVIDAGSGSPYAAWQHSEEFRDSFIMFNVTNPDKILAGDRPVVTVVGPFVYKTINDKVRPNFFPDTGIVSYYNRMHWEFDAEETRKATNGKITSDDMVFTSVNVLLNGVTQQALASGDVDLVTALVQGIYSIGPWPKGCTLGPGTCTNTSAPPAVTDWATKKDDTGAFVKIAVRDLIFGYNNSRLMTLVNNVNAKFGQKPQPPAYPGMAQNMTEAAAVQNGLYTVYTGATNLSLASQLITFNGNTTLVACTGNPCNRATFSGYSAIWNSSFANQVMGSLGDQFPPGRANLEGSKQVVMMTLLGRHAPVENVLDDLTGKGGQTIDYKGIEMLKFTYSKAFMQPDPAYYQTQVGMLNQSMANQLAKVRVTNPMFQGFGGGAGSGQTPQYTNPGFFTNDVAADGTDWLSDNFFGVEPNTGKTMATHSRFQLNMEMGPQEFPGLNVTWFPGMRKYYVPINADDSHGAISDADAAKFKNAVRTTTDLYHDSRLVGAIVTATALLMAARALLAAKSKQDDSKSAYQPL